MMRELFFRDPLEPNAGAQIFYDNYDEYGL